MMKSSGLNSARAFRVRSFTTLFSLLKCIKSDHKIQDMGAENVYVSATMIRFSHNDSLINSNFLPSTGGFNFTFKVYFFFFISVFNDLCLKYQNIIQL